VKHVSLTNTFSAVLTSSVLTPLFAVLTPPLAQDFCKTDLNPWLSFVTYLGILASRQTELWGFLSVFSLRLSCHPISYLGGEHGDRETSVPLRGDRTLWMRAFSEGSRTR
jgi:hypothetical protein